MTNVINLFSEPTYKTEPAHKIRFFIKNTDIEILTAEFDMIQFNCYDRDGDSPEVTEEEWAEMAAEVVFGDHLDGYDDELQAYLDALVDSDTLEIRATRIHTDMRSRPEWLQMRVV
jgi:hypothetical protein